jgi:hypothetical protein
MSDFSSSDLDAINKAIANGTLTVRFSTPGGAERFVTYRSLEELREIKRQIQESIGGTPRAAGSRCSSAGRAAADGRAPAIPIPADPRPSGAAVSNFVNTGQAFEAGSQRPRTKGWTRAGEHSEQRAALRAAHDSQSLAPRRRERRVRQGHRRSARHQHHRHRIEAALAGEESRVPKADPRAVRSMDGRE